MFERGAPRTATTGSEERQREVIRWFDQVYQRRGLAYLRPPHAYEVFLEIMSAEGLDLPAKQLLDVACGPGLLLDAAHARGLQGTGIDLSSVALKKARERGADAGVAQGSAEHLPYRDACFDVVTCLGSLERFLAPDQALAEMRRVLRRDGFLVLMVRNSRTLQWSLLRSLGLRNEAGHQGAENHETWQELLRDSGFAVQAVYPDQWPLMRGQRVLRFLGARGDFSTLRKSRLPIAFANELIYVCRHAVA